MQDHRHAAPAPERSACAPAAALLLLALAVAAAGCQSRTGLAPGLSGMRTDMKVLGTRTLGPYLVARLDMNGKNLEAYTLPTERCTGVFAEGAAVVYVDTGPQGVYRRGDLECQALGVGNLLVWRDRRRHSSAEIAPRTQAAFRVIHRGDEFALLRGQFPGASRIGFTGDYDLVAVIPVTGECAAILDQRAASLEYRDKGPRVLSLVGPGGLCEVHGLAQPPPQQPPPDRASR
ncbi:MAG TPA: hypothetical protein ENO23_04345 [Alphaproteobacteria bacterium]|nr:hypothetical protein [Alphaproteobacteria bacterium]